MRLEPWHSNLKPRKKIEGTKRRIWTCFILSPLISLLTVWIIAALYFLVLIEIDESGNYNIQDHQGVSVSKSHGHIIKNVAHHDPVNDAPQSHHHQHQHQEMMERSSLLSRNPNVTITSSARGNLGPPSVLNQDPPGKDWIKDRWQAASDMHGTAIAGRHWVLLDFTAYLSSSFIEPAAENHGDGSVDGGASSTSTSSSLVAAAHITKVVLDWETAYAENYRVEGRLTPPTTTATNNEKGLSKVSDVDDDDDDGEWCVLYDGALDNNDGNNAIHKGHTNSIYPHRSVEEHGQSPGVKQKLPLHIIHTIDWSSEQVVEDKSKEGVKNCRILRYLRVFVRKPARGWGVSLWEVDVFGTVVG